MAKDEFGTNKENLANLEQDTYVETLVINDKMVNVFQNDYGQCYWFQWLEDGELKSNSCGTYNMNYKEEIEYFFKPRIDSLSESLHDLRIEVRELGRELYKLKDKVK